MIRKYIFRKNISTVVPTAEYGYLYNFFSVSDSRGLAPAGCRVMSNSDWDNLIAATDGSSAIRLMEAGTTHWDTGNIATNSLGFSAIGGGMRGSTGEFEQLKDAGLYWSSDGRTYVFSNGATDVTYTIYQNDHGYSVRHCRDSELEEGTIGQIIGNDGTAYATKVIAGIEYMTENLRETKFANGESIINITDAEQWAACQILPEVRDFFGAGYVFAVDTVTGYIYIVTPEPAVIGKSWGAVERDFVDSTENYLGGGVINTANLFNSYDVPFSFTAELVHNGYSDLFDWYVPCMVEVDLFLENVSDLLTIPDLGSNQANRINSSNEYDGDMYNAHTTAYGWNQVFWKLDNYPTVDGFTFGVRRVAIPNSSARCVYNNDPGNVLGIENLVTYNGVPVTHNGEFVTYTP